jgi:ABC-type antimicrobial peptide transport system permease subunit
MIKNYLKTAWRNFYKNKFFSAINIIGLAGGMAVAILIGLWIWDEFSFDKYNKNYDRVAVVMQQSTVNGEIGVGSPSPVPLASELRNSYGSEFKHVVLSWWNRDHILSSGNNKFTRIGKFMEPAATDLLSLNMIKGTRDGLKDPSSIILSASTAKIIFGEADPMDKMMLIDGKLNVKVTGVYEDIPDASQFKNVSFIAPWDLLAATDELIKNVKNSWGFDATEIYVQLADNADIQKVSARIRDVKLNKVKDDKDLAVYKPQILLQPMSRWHLYNEWKNGINTGGSIQFVWLFGLIGLFVLLLACINFMNLATARSEKRAKEVGIRKAIGSLKKQLIIQFFTESFLIVALAFLLSLILAQITLPFFNQLAGKKISIPWLNAYFWLAGIGFSLFTGLIAGSYPALYLSSFEPIKVLKGTFKTGRNTSIPRKVLVVLQFSVSVILIIGTIIVFQQIQFAKNRPLGYDSNGVIQLQLNTPELNGHEAALRNDLLKTGAVMEIAESSSPATGVWSGRSGFEWPGKDPSLQTEFGAVAVTHEYGKTMGWQFKEGRDFSKDFATDSSALVVNEAAVKFMNLKEPVGITIKWDDENYKIIGVIKNMVMESPYDPVRQIVYSLKNEKLNFIFIKINPSQSIGNALNQIQSSFEKYAPASPFDYKFVDENFAKKFSAEERVGKLASSFAILAILISCLGLFGMASFMAEQRTKEIGVRKVLGASVFTVWKLLSKESVVLVFISFMIAIPVSWWAMYNWLQNYEYRTSISLWVFVATGIMALVITLATVSCQAIKAALANPVKSLRRE